jgi:hypothetical protein
MDIRSRRRFLPMSTRRCAGWQEMIIDRLADELADVDSILLEQHIQECPSCASEERSVRALYERVRATGEEIPAGISQEIHERLLREFRALRGDPVSAPWRATEGTSRAAAEVSKRRKGAAERIQRGRPGAIIPGFIPGFLGRPIPVYGALALVVGACVAGAWFGRIDARRGETPSPIEGVSGVSGSIAERGDSSGSGRWPMSPITRFIVTPSDAIALIGALGNDTL